MKSVGFIIIYYIIFLLLLPSGAIRSDLPQSMNSSEIRLALEKMRVTGSALYIAAHPDDENTALLAYLSKEKRMRTGYLSMTRGDGGQNLIGPESDELLGIIRTQELLAARRIDGAQQFFTRAIDFGYSKSPEETLEIWDRNKILSDIVWIIRSFRPDILITRFTPEIGGHGHHRASAILAIEAFHAAGDSTRFPEQLKYVRPWKPVRIIWNTWRPYLRSQGIDTTSLPYVDLGSYNPLLGKSYGEIAALSRSMHKSQGFGASPWRGSYREYFMHLAGDSATSDIFENISMNWSDIPGGGKIDNMLEKALLDLSAEQPADILPELLEILSSIRKLPDSHVKRVKMQELTNIIYACAGMWLEATAEIPAVSPGDTVAVNITVLNRSDFPLSLRSVEFSSVQKDTVLNQILEYNKPLNFAQKVVIPAETDYTIPYWLENKAEKGTYRIPEQQLIGKAESPPPLSVTFHLQAAKEPLDYQAEVRYKWTDPVEGQRIRKLAISPPYTAEFTNKVYIFNDTPKKAVTLRLSGQTGSASGNISLSVPYDWKTDPLNVPFRHLIPEQTDEITFQVTPPADTSRIVVKAAGISGAVLRQQQIIDYSHFPVQALFPETDAIFLRLNIKKFSHKIGYIMGSGDDIPEILRQLGYEVVLLNEHDLTPNNLSQFDAVITGIRAYNTNQWLKSRHRELMDYVKDGGTMIVQYSVTRGLVSDTLGPYPFRISHDRVSVEEAPVVFTLPDHPLLNFPNKITQQDFEGWVQERGLYFADRWDSSYQTPLSSADPGEELTAGGLLFSTYGKGVFIYSGYAFFRQLPAGIPGAIKLFVNLIESGGQP